MKKLIEFVLATSPDELLETSLQDMSLCHIYGQQSNVNDPAQAEAIVQQADKWLATSHEEFLTTEGRRHQTLLRELVDRLQNAKAGSMAYDELSLLETIYDFAKRSKAAELFGRVVELLHPFIPAITARRDSLMKTRGLPVLSQRLRVVTTDDILKSRQQEIKVLAGIRLPTRGPMLAHEGQLRVLGDVPENTTVVVKNGDCIVDGYVTGRVVTSGMCEVRRNISGVVITRDGDVRADSILEHSLAVSKTGSVMCRNAQNPELVFAGIAIRVSEGTIQGRFISQVIAIKGSALGGEYHVSDTIHCPLYRQSENRPLSIVFRHRLSCRDYGEIPGREMGRDLSRTIRLRDQLSHAKRSTRMAGGEVEQFASTALMYILGGEKVKESLDKIIDSRRRLDILNRILVGLNSLYSNTEQSLRAGTDEVQSEDDVDTSTVDAVQQELDVLHDDHPVDDDLLAERDALMEMQTAVKSSSRDKAVLTRMLTGVSHRLTLWLKESKELEDEIRELEKVIQAHVGLETFITGKGKKTPKVVALRQVMEAAKKKEDSNPAFARCQSAFVSMMLRNIRKRIQAASKYRDISQGLVGEFEVSAEHVWTKYQVRIDEVNDDEERFATATGCYEDQIKLASDPSVLGDEITSSNGRYVLTQSMSDREVTFQCRAGVISECAEQG